MLLNFSVICPKNPGLESFFMMLLGTPLTKASHNITNWRFATGHRLSENPVLKSKKQQKVQHAGTWVLSHLHTMPRNRSAWKTTEQSGQLVLGWHSDVSQWCWILCVHLIVLHSIPRNSPSYRSAWALDTQVVEGEAVAGDEMPHCRDQKKKKNWIKWMQTTCVQKAVHMGRTSRPALNLGMETLNSRFWWTPRTTNHGNKHMANGVGVDQDLQFFVLQASIGLSGHPNFSLICPVWVCSELLCPVFFSVHQTYQKPIFFSAELKVINVSFALHAGGALYGVSNEFHPQPNL